MGKVFLSLPPELGRRIAKAGIKTLVETGTYRGGTAAWAAEHFEQVYTIEGYLDYYNRTSQALAHLENVHFIFGDSRQRLPEVLAELDQPALIWLDAHWLGSTELSAGTSGECPLMDELKAISARGVRHYILIDDLHCFQGELNKGSFRELWPTPEQIYSLIRAGFPDYYITTSDDVIIAVPPEARKTIEQYMKYRNLAFVVATSNNYLNALNGFAYLFNKNVGIYPATILRYEIRPPKMPGNIGNLSVGKMADFTWSSGLSAFLAHWDCDLLVLLLEDYYISKADVKDMQALWNYMTGHSEIAKIDLSGDRMKFEHRPYKKLGALNLIQSTAEAEYRGSIQAAIWRKDYLEKHLNPSWDAWQFEKHGCRDDGLILGTTEPILRYVNAIGGHGRNPGEFDRKKIPPAMWEELRAHNLVA